MDNKEDHLDAPGAAPGAVAIVAPDAFDPLIGECLAGRYQIVRRIGEGGMGAVYEARHTVIGKRVAVKVLLERLVENQELVKRLLQEARMASSIGHEHIVDVADFGTTEDGRAYVVMEYLDGEPLSALLNREAPLPVGRALGLLKQVAGALGAAHEKGIVHRDIKPENVYLIRRDEEDFAKVVDFGVSKVVRGADEGPESMRLTRTGAVLGTPLYMSPEQARGDDDIDARADVWAMGVLLYECLTGEVPFRARNYLQIIAQVLNTKIKEPSLVRPALGLAESVDAVVMKALQKDRDQRYQTMQALEDDLDRLLKGDHNVALGRMTQDMAAMPVLPDDDKQPRWYLAVLAVVVMGCGLALALAQKAGNATLSGVGPEIRSAPPSRVGVTDEASQGRGPTEEKPAVPSLAPPEVAGSDSQLGSAHEPARGNPEPSLGGPDVRSPQVDGPGEPKARGPGHRRAGPSVKKLPAENASAGPKGNDAVIRLGDELVPRPERLYQIKTRKGAPEVKP